MQQAGYVDEWDDWGEAPAASPREITAPAVQIQSLAVDPSSLKMNVQAESVDLLRGLDPALQNHALTKNLTGDCTAITSDDFLLSCKPDEIVPFPLGGKPSQFPAFMSRSAMFAVGLPKLAPNMNQGAMHIPAQGRYSITLHGSRLTMRDKRLWEVAIEFAKASGQGVGAAFHIPLLDFGKAMGWVDRSSKSREWVWSGLSRLADARIKFSLPDGTEGMGALISTLSRNGGTVSLRLNPDFILKAFGHDTQFTMNPARRCQLKTTLAQWLHDFFSTHTTTPPLTLGYLRELSGYSAQVRYFPKELASAMSQLRTSAPELVSDFEIKKDGKDSSNWKLCITKGAELPSYTLPMNGGTGSSRRDARSPKQRGVQL